jgi:hypothetical protein
MIMLDPEKYFNSLDESDKERCWETIAGYGEDAEDPSFIVLQISAASLHEKDFDDAELLEFADLGSWESLNEALSQEEIEKHKTDFNDVTSFVVVLYCDGHYVTSAQGD